MELSFKLDAFEGPLDLLLHLIEKNKVSIYDIPIALITQQYLEYMDMMRRQDLEIMSEFLVMAATLIDIKARMLLPPEKNEEGEEIDPREELVQKLLEYKMFKYMSADLRQMEEEGLKRLYRGSSIPEEVRKYRPAVDPDEVLGDVTLGQLHAVFRDVLKRSIDRIDPIRGTFGQIRKETVDASEILRDVGKRIRSRKRCTFRSLLSSKMGKMYIVVTFLTILELMKTGMIEAHQDETFGDIMIEAREDASWDEETVLAEWEEAD